MLPVAVALFFSDGNATSTFVFGDGRISIHADHMSTGRAAFHERRISIGRIGQREATRIRPILGFWGSKFHKNGIFPVWDADEPPCKIDAASFIVGGEIRNRTKKTNKHTNSNRYIHTLHIGMCG